MMDDYDYGVPREAWDWWREGERRTRMKLAAALVFLVLLVVTARDFDRRFPDGFDDLLSTMPPPVEQPAE